MSVLLLVLLLLLIAINGFFVAAEFALVRSRRGKIEQLADEGESGAEAVVEQLDKIDESLSACQIGITIASIGIGFLGEPSLAKLIEPIFGGLSHGVAAGLSLAIAFTLVTALHISVGEQVPKMLAIANAERTARRVSRPLNWFRVATAPVTMALSWFSNGIVRLFGVNPTRPRRAPHGRGPEADHRQLAARRPPRPRRGGDARRRLPPARAGGARGDDADPGGRSPSTPRRRSRRRCGAASPPATPAWS